MRLKSISLKNIRSYENETIFFPSGSLLLAGDIGCGKSTILQAVEFALFGTQRGTLDASALLRKGSQNAEVSLDFELDNKSYTVKRTLKGSQQGPGCIIVDGVQEDIMPTELKSKLMTLLGYPVSTIFRYSVYASQEQMKHIIMERPEARLDTLRAIFGIDKYKTIVDNSQIVVKELKKDCLYKEGQISDLPQKEEELKLLQPKLEEKIKVKIEIGIQVTKQRDELLIAQNKFKEANDELKKLELKQKDLVVAEVKIKDINLELEQISNQKIKLNSDIAQLQKQCDELQIVDTASSTNDGANKDENSSYDQVLDEINRLETIIQRNKNHLETFEEKKSLYLDQLKGLVKDVTFNEIMSKVISDLEIIDVKIKVVEEKKLKLHDVEKVLSQKLALLDENKKQEGSIKGIDICPTCKQNVDETHKQSVCDEIELKNKNLQHEIDLLNDEIKLLSEVCVGFNELQLKKQDLVRKKIELEQQIIQFEKDKILRDDLQSKLDDVESKLKTISSFDFIGNSEKLSQLKLKETELKKIEILKQKKEGWLKLIEQMKKNIFDLDNKAEFLNKTSEETKLILEKLNNDLEHFIELKENVLKKEKDLSNLRSNYDKISIEFEGIRKDEEFLKSNIDKIKKEIESKKDLVKNVTWNKQMRSWINDFFIKLMNTIEKNVLLQIYHEFNSNFSDWFDILIEDDSIQVSIDEQFTPKVIQNGYDIDVSSLSGGERTSVALAYRLALNKIVNELIPDIKTSDLLILDEPTEGFSTEQLDRVREVLDLLKVSQLIMVSHEPKMEGFVDNVIRIEKNQNVSRVY